MSDVFSKLGDSLKSTFKVATEQTQKSVDQVACRTDIMNKRNELKKLFMQLGEVQYRCYTEGVEDSERDLLYGNIAAIKTQIDELETHLDKVVDEQKSSLDSYKNVVKSTWEDITTPEEKKGLDEEDVEVLKVCPVCHTGNHDYAAYCIKCGNKFE